MNVPTMAELLRDPVYRTYMRTAPRLPENMIHGKPWQVWIKTETSWLTGSFCLYADAWRTAVRRMNDAVDVCVVSRRIFFAPPGRWEEYKVRVNTKPPRIDTKLRWVNMMTWPHNLRWCGRCRRPSRFIPLRETHHALRHQTAITYDGNKRCVFCAIRWEAMPSEIQMWRIGA